MKKIVLLIISAGLIAALTGCAPTVEKVPQLMTPSSWSKKPFPQTQIELPPKPEKKPVVVDIPAPEIKDIFSPYTLNFDYDRWNLDGYFDLLNDISAKAKTAKKVDIKGRTDGKYPHSYDEYVGKMRAETVRKYLVGKGVKPEVIFISYASSADFIADNQGEDSAINRRVEINLIF